MKDDVLVRAAQPRDEEAIERLLIELKLPVSGVREWLGQFWIAESGDRIVGVAGLEIYEDGALLRSVAVASDRRSSGLGRILVERVLQSARDSGVRQVFLLTTTAERYFPKLGFRDIARDLVPPGVRTSIEFREACPASAVAMSRGVQ